MGKSGKFINPTDQARKEARRKELKKNKKQRQQVREAVIKQKDPKHILNDLDELDKLEFDIQNPPPYSAKVFQEKRRKLKEQWNKIYLFYQKEDPKLAYELKQMELDYERRHQMISQHYDSIMQAQKVKLDDIPLPDIDIPPIQPSLILPPLMPTQNIDYNLMESTVPPVENGQVSKSILKSSSSNSILAHQISENIKLKLNNLKKLPPGPPSTQPPDLNEFVCDEDEKELSITLDNQLKSSDKQKKIRFDDNLKTLTNNSTKSSKLNFGPSAISYSTFQTTSQSTISLVGQVNLNSKQSVPLPPPPPTQPYQQKNMSIYKTSYQQQSHEVNVASTTTIEAKPVLRNKVAEITKFVPTNLIVRRDTLKNKLPNEKGQLPKISLLNQPYNYMSYQQQQYTNLNPLNYGASTSIDSSSVTNNNIKNVNNNRKSTDAAYESFMKEIQEISGL